MENKKLQVGDAVIKYNLRTPVDRYIIERVTKTQAISGEMRFNIECNGKSVRRVGYSGGFIHYKLATPEIQEEYHRNMLVRSIIGVDFSKLDTKKLEKISEILFEKINL